MKATTSTSQTLPASGVWAIEVCADAAPVVTVTLPNGAVATPSVTAVVDRYRAEFVVTAPGRYVARVVGLDGAFDFTAWVETVTAAADMPDLVDVEEYLGEQSWTDDELEGALAAEAAAQRAACRVPAAYPADLREALLRRVARNLALRAVPLAVLRGDAEAGNTILPGRDPEVRRLESPYRKLVMG